MKIQFKGYVPEPMPSGAIRHRVRVEGQPGKRITIPVGPGDEMFSEHYHAARRGLVLKVEEKPTPRKNTLDFLVHGYLARLKIEVQSGSKDIKTYNQRQNILERSCEFLDDDGDRMGDLHGDITPIGVVHIRDSWGAATAQADNSVKALSAMYIWAMEKGHIAYNPAAGVKRVHKSKGGAVPWSIDDVRRFAKQHPIGTTAYLWLTLSMCTGIRSADTVWIGPKQSVIQEGQRFLEWQPGKKGSAFVSVPVLDLLEEAIQAMKVQSTSAFIVNANGNPFKSADSLRNRVNKWTSEAGLKNRSQHGLRKALAILLAENGASDHQIMSIMAHNKATTTAIYTEKSRRKVMAEMALMKLPKLSLMD